MPHSFTYDHRKLRTGHPVRSGVLKQFTGCVVVGWVTTSEFQLLYVRRFCSSFCSPSGCWRIYFTLSPHPLSSPYCLSCKLVDIRSTAHRRTFLETIAHLTRIGRSEWHRYVYHDPVRSTALNCSIVTNHVFLCD